MAAHWLQEEKAPSHAESVELLFPIRGQYIWPTSCDRVFWEYREETSPTRKDLFSPGVPGNLQGVGHCETTRSGFSCFRLQSRTDLCLKKPLPMKLMKNKRYFIRKSPKTIPVFRAEPNYTNLIDPYLTITKQGKHFSFAPARVEYRQALLWKMKKKRKKTCRCPHVSGGSLWRELGGRYLATPSSSLCLTIMLLVQLSEKM